MVRLTRPEIRPQLELLEGRWVPSAARLVATPVADSETVVTATKAPRRDNIPPVSNPDPDADRDNRRHFGSRNRPSSIGALRAPRRDNIPPISNPDPDADRDNRRHFGSRNRPDAVPVGPSAVAEVLETPVADTTTAGPV